MDNLSGIFNGKVAGKEEKDLTEDVLSKMKQQNSISKPSSYGTPTGKALNDKKLESLFPKISKSSKGKTGFETMVSQGENKPFKQPKENLKGSGFFNMMGSANIPKSNPIDKVGQFFGNTKGKQKTPLGKDFNKQLNSMFKINNNVNVNNKLKNVFKTNNNNNTNKKMNQIFNVKGTVKGKDLNKKITNMLGNPGGTEGIGWKRAQQQVGLSPMGDFDGDKVMNMLDCNPRNPNKQGPLDTMGQWGRVLTGKTVGTEVGRLEKYNNRIQPTTKKDIVIDIDPAKAGQAILRGTTAGAVAVGRGLKTGAENILYGAGLLKTEEEKRREQQYAHQERLARAKATGLKEEEIPIPITEIPRQIPGARLWETISAGAGRIHEGITREVLGARAGLGAALPTTPGTIEKMVGWRTQPGMVEYMAAVGREPLAAKMGLVALGAPVPYEEKARMVAPPPTGETYLEKVQLAVGGIREEELERQREMEKLRIARIEVERKRLAVPVAPVPLPVAPMPIPIPPPVRPIPGVPGVPGQPMIPPVRAVPYYQQPATPQLAQAEPTIQIYSPESKRQVTYRRGPYRKKVPTITYEQQQY